MYTVHAMLCLFTGGCACYGYPCLLVDKHGACLFTGGWACYGMPVYWWMRTLCYACLLVNVPDMGMPVYWWTCMLWACLFTGECARYGMPVYW